MLGGAVCKPLRAEAPPATSEFPHVVGHSVEDIHRRAVEDSLPVVGEDIDFAAPIIEHSISVANHIYESPISIDSGLNVDWSRLLRLLVMPSDLAIKRPLIVSSIWARVGGGIGVRQLSLALC